MLATDNPTEVVSVPILSLRPGSSPRLNGQDKEHIARLAETESPLPPIMVDRRTMRVIDGMHRLMAASMQGRDTIEVVFFDGSEADLFLRAVQENVRHGLPLSLADRRAAAERIVVSHPHLSNRAIGDLAGLAAKSVAAIRKRSTGDAPQSNARVGRDGRVRPLDSGQARQRAAELLSARPDASIRDVARTVGLSPSTVLDVRNRIGRSQPPVPGRAGVRGERPAPPVAADDDAQPAGNGTSPARRPGPGPASPAGVPPDPAAAVQRLLRDPSLRNNEKGKGMLRLLHVNALGGDELPGVAAAVPAHCVNTVLLLARHYAKMWQDFARELDGRARIIDPSAATHSRAG